MSSLTNINSNSSVVNVGRTTPVSPGQQPAAKSIPVVLATDQTAIPVVEQNKIQSEVALSLLGIPRAEVALGIFADVNTYDVNPSEWSPEPATYTPGHGIKHLPEEAGALIQAPKDEVAILTSKRFFRYQPGRVSAATFGVKSTVTPIADYENGTYDLNPSIRKYGIFDKFDGYYWEVVADGAGDRFGVVRRTQSLLKYVPVPFGAGSTEQSVDHAIAGKGPDSTTDVTLYPAEYIALTDNRFTLAKQVVDAKIAACRRDVGYFIDGVGYDITLGTNYNAIFLGIAETNSIDLNQTVYDNITATKAAILALSAVSSDPTSTSRVTSYFTELLNIVQNDRTVASAITFTNPSSGRTTSQIACKDRLQNNLKFIVAEINAYVAATYPNNGHNVDKCTRDVKYAVNAFSYDMLYGGNSATYDQARFFLYFDGDADNDPASIISSHKVATVAAYNRLVSIIGDIVLGNDVVKTTTGSLPNTLTQDKTGNSAIQADATALQNLAQVISNIINLGTTDPIDPTKGGITKTFPDVAWAATALKTSKTSIETNRSSIITSVVPGGYTTEDLKCIRDLNYFFAGASYDQALGTNYNAIFLGHAEANSADISVTVIDKITAAQAAVVALTDVAASSTSVSRINTFYATVKGVAAGLISTTGTVGSITGSGPWTATISGMTDTIGLSAGATISATAGTGKLYGGTPTSCVVATVSTTSITFTVTGGTAPTAGTVTNITGVAPTLTFTTTPPVSAYPDANTRTSRIAAKDKLIANKGFIQAEINAYVNATYPAHDHNEAKCTRDVGYAIDGFCYDILYGGNSATYDSAKFFYFAGISGIDPTHQVQTADAYARLRDVVGSVVQGISITPSSPNLINPNTGLSVTQTLTGNNATLDDAVTVQGFAQVLVNVVSSGLAALPATRTVPSITWATTAIQTASAAIVANQNAIVGTLIPGGSYSAIDAACLRDLDYAIDAYLYDLKWGGNGYTSVHATNYSGPLTAYLTSSEVTIHTALRDAIVDLFETITPNNPASTALTAIAARTITAVNNSASERVTNFFTNLTTTLNSRLANFNGPATAAKFPVTGLTPLSLVGIKKQLGTNRSFITAEINAYAGHSGTLADKCTRDVGYLLNAFTYDMVYGGNSATYDAAKFFWFNGVDQSSAHKTQTVAAYTRLKAIIGYIAQGNNTSWTKTPANALTQDITGDVATSTDASALQDLVQVIIDVINNGVGSLPATRTTPTLTNYNLTLKTAKAGIDVAKASIISTLIPGTSANDIKCQRDLGYVLDAVGFDVVLGTNYNAIFQGAAESNSLSITAAVTNALASAKNSILALPAVSGLPVIGNTADTLVSSFYTELLKIVNGGAASTVKYTVQTNTTTSQQGVVAQLTNNKTFITTEINAWVDDPAQGSYGHTTDSRNRCTRDVGYLLDAFKYDMFYGGNSATYDAAKFFWFNGVEQTLPEHKAQTIGAYTRLKAIIGDIAAGVSISKTTPGNTLTQTSTGYVATGGDPAALQALVQIVIDVITSGVGSLPATRITPSVTSASLTLQSAKAAIDTAKSNIISTLVPGTTANDIKCQRDLGYFIDAVGFDLALGTNYNAVFQGHAEANSLDLSVAVKNMIAASRDAILALPLVKSINYGSATPIQTVLSGKKYFLANALSTKDAAGNTITYTLPSPNPNGVTVEELQAKCQRDVKYVIEGYLRDLQFGGNMGTVYNAKKYYSNGALIIYTQTSGGVPAEIARHTYLRTLLTGILSQYGLSSYITKFTDLANLIIANFSVEYTGQASYGTAPQFGDLCILRDNLIMTHAAVHDPSLLKPKKNVVVIVDSINNTLTAAEGEFIVGQHINFFGTEINTNAAGLIANKLYKVKTVSGYKGNVITLTDPLLNDNATVDIGTTTETIYINPNVPFVFPSIYYTGEDPLDPLNFVKADGAFPYMYASNGRLPVSGDETRKVGYIDTARNTSQAGDAAILKAQIDALNLTYNNWIKENVDPKYYAVYEFRIPRSRFSTDQLNGQTNNVVYSDIATSASGKAYAGQAVLTTEGIQSTNTSVWNYEFGKVTMLKIEFSWYGAVGALFLAYVPVSNGEARWVRVHHLRASNQLKIPSLGNATLPITYLCYGGGSVSRLGIDDQTDKGYQSVSNHIVKYGASYYIDGGDRGTVRLYSYSNDTSVNVYGAKYSLGSLSTATDDIGRYIDVSGVSGLPSNNTFFMYARLTTSSNEDQNIEIVWVDGEKLYINKDTDLVSTSGLTLIANRPSVIFGLKAKENILNVTGVGVRNRVQVYPTKLSTANLGAVPVKMKILKTPYFQPKITVTGGFTLSTNYPITPDNLPLSTQSYTYLSSDNDYVYGWFRADVGTVFGKLYKSNGNYYFSLLQTFSVPVTLISGIPFLCEGRFSFTGTTLTNTSESAITKERLSSVFISSQIQCPIPKSGIEVASFFLKPGSDQFDLLSYFDYNKDYLSFPLTNQIESLYLTSDSTQLASATAIEINSSLTWEEQ